MSAPLPSDRRARVQQILVEARALPAEQRTAFVERECGDDAALRRDVAALLEESESRGPPHDRPTPGTAARMLQGVFDRTATGTSGTSDLWIGQTVSHFSVEKRLGSGGMGMVYQARDVRLGRAVALKFLSWSLCGDAEAKTRFIQEAQAASALDHVNITTIHEIGETPDGQLFIAMALHSGETLGQHIGRGPLPVDQASDIVVQLGSALAAAHARGIVHRDIKPANVMITTEGVAKLLDFGIAKLTGSATMTLPGTMMGTVAYMSPEQARGDPVDHRTDLWSLGVVWYEMLCGRRPFQGENAQSIVHGILERDPPPPGSLTGDIPVAIAAIVLRCLVKDPAQRYQSADELLTDLRRVSEGKAPAPRTHRVPRAGRTGRRRAPLVLGATFVAAAVMGGVWVLGWSRDRVPVFSRPQQVTTSTALEDYPSMSPDGRTVAYESNETGTWNIWVTQPGAETTVNRTAGRAGNNRYPSWSPDGRSIAFWSDGDGIAYYIMPAFGGEAQAIVAAPHSTPTNASPPAWSRDGGELAVVNYLDTGDKREQVAQIIDLTTRRIRVQKLPGTEEARLDLAWSPDGAYLAYIDAAQQPAETTTLRIVRLADGASLGVTDGQYNARNPLWMADSRSLLFASNRSGPADWWMCTLDGEGMTAGPARQMTTAMEIRHASFSSDGRRMAYSKGRWVSNIWRLPILTERLATWSDAEVITNEYAFIEFLDLSADGQRLIFSSDRRGNQDIWTMPASGGSPTRLTSHPALDWAPEWSPDESMIAFYSNRTGDREIWSMPASGEPAIQLTHSPGLDATPHWSADGREIVFRSERDGKSDIWAMSADGSRERQVTRHHATDYGPVFSPDGTWVYFASFRSGEAQIWRVPAGGGDAEAVTPPGVGGSVCWSPDGRYLYFPKAADPQGNLWACSVEEQTVRQISDFSGRRGVASLQAPASDGQYVYFSWREDLGDVWVMDVSHR